MLIVRVTRSVAIGEVSIAVIPVGLAGKDRVGPDLVRIGNEDGRKNHTNIDRRPACKETLTFFGHQRQARAYLHYIHLPSIGWTSSPTPTIDFNRELPIQACPQNVSTKNDTLVTSAPF